MSDRDVYFGDFERLGEEAVRNNFVLGRYGEKRRELAQEWLRQQSQGREDAAREAEIDLARRATEATESAAASARAANRIARQARNISYFAGGVSLVVAVLTVISLVAGR